MADQENECTALKIKIHDSKQENESLKKDTANIFDNVKEVFEASIISTIEAVLNRLTNEKNLFESQTTNQLNSSSAQMSTIANILHENTLVTPKSSRSLQNSASVPTTTLTPPQEIQVSMKRCDVCEKTFTFKRSLTQHMKSVHR